MASGNQLLQWSAESGIPPSSAFAPVSRRNNHMVALFDAVVDESLDFTGIMPPNYAGGGVTLKIIWMAATATAGACRWAAAFERHDLSSLDLDSDSLATANTAGTTAPGTSGQLVSTSITFTNGAQMDSVAVGEEFRLRITRDADGTSGTDDMTGDAQLKAVELLET